jgi:hypothetical protein
MATNGIRRRWRRRAIVLLVIVNTALWASFVWSSGTSRHSHGRTPAAAQQVSHSR